MASPEDTSAPPPDAPPPLPVTGDPADDKGKPILAVMWALTALTLFLVVVRMYVRARIVQNFGLDDWLIMFGMFLGLVYLGVTTANVSIGYGKHAFTLSLESLMLAMQLNSISFIFGILSFAVPKLAVAAMLDRILNPSRVQRWILWGLVILGFMISVACIFVLMFMCNPPRALWDITITDAKCFDVWILIDYAIFTGAFSAFTDLYLAIYPITVLFKLNMSLRKKLALSAALGLGIIASAMAIIKCTQLKGLANKDDYTYGTAELVLWTNVEADMVVIASCIPTLQPLLERLKKGTFSSSRGGSNSKHFNKLSKDASHNQTIGSYNVGGSKPHKSADRSLGMTDVDSQESILADQHGGGDGFSSIRRTDKVQIEYEMQDRNPGGNTGENARAGW